MFNGLREEKKDGKQAGGPIKMATILEVVQAISQIVGEMGYDGAKTRTGEPVKIGLRREEGNPLLDKRVMDGFGVKFNGDQLIVTYHSELMLNEIYKGNLESEVEQRIQEVVNFIKKEYKGTAKAKGSLTLTPIGEVKVRAENSSRVRYWVTAHRAYQIKAEGVDPVKAESKDSVEAKFKKFVELGGLGGKRPQNDTRKG
jgi:hypothetical protein